MCEYLLTLAIVGAVETSPDWIELDLLQESQIETIYVPTAVYTDCFTSTTK